MYFNLFVGIDAIKIVGSDNDKLFLDIANIFFAGPFFLPPPLLLMWMQGAGGDAPP